MVNLTPSFYQKCGSKYHRMGFDTPWVGGYKYYKQGVQYTMVEDAMTR